ncbi:hypothetical protein ZONE111904_07040 [Zobellia nedashkovskayae]
MISQVFTSFDLNITSVVIMVLGFMFIGFVISSVIFGQHDHKC